MTHHFVSAMEARAPPARIDASSAYAAAVTASAIATLRPRHPYTLWHHTPPPTMQLTVFSSDDQTYFLEIGPDMALGDLVALVAAEVRTPARASLSITG